MELRECFAEDLRQLGLRRGDAVMIHSSFKSLGGGLSPDEVFAGIFDVIGEEGTLLMPALSYEAVSAAQPMFDREKTPSCVGFLPEYFRTKVPGVVRSLHATHSVCAKGKLAQELTCGHENDPTPVGENSPITKLCNMGGKILFLGCDPDHNTAMHGVEEAAHSPYALHENNRAEYLLRDGEKTIARPSLCHDFVKADHWLSQRYSRVIDLMEEQDKHFGKVLQADCWLLDGKALWEVGVKKMKQDPYYFVERIDEIL